MIKLLQKFLDSPWAGVLTFIFGFMLATTVGERDLLGAVLGKIFPDEGAVGFASLSLSPMGTLRDGDDQLMLFRHSDRTVHSVKILQQGSGEPGPVFAGSMNGKALFLGSPAVITYPRVVIEAELSPSDLMAVVSHTIQPRQDIKYSFRANNISDDFTNRNHSPLFYTANELRGFRIMHYMYIAAAFLVGLSIKSRQLSRISDSNSLDD